MGKKKVDLQYYSMENMQKRLHPKEPVFVLRASDEMAMEIVREYGTRLVQKHGATQQQFDKGIAALHVSNMMGKWKLNNPDKVKLPDNPDFNI